MRDRGQGGTGEGPGEVGEAGKVGEARNTYVPINSYKVFFKRAGEAREAVEAVVARVAGAAR